MVVTEAAGGSGEWRTFGERTIYDSPKVWLGQVDVGLPDGERIWRHVVRMHRSALLVLLDEHAHVLLLWRYRFVQGRWGWELPGGLVDEGEEPAEAAVRELEEQAGYRVAEVRHLVSFQPLAESADCEHVVFVGCGGERAGGAADGYSSGYSLPVERTETPPGVSWGRLSW